MIGLCVFVSGVGFFPGIKKRHTRIYRLILASILRGQAQAVPGTRTIYRGLYNYYFKQYHQNREVAKHVGHSDLLNQMQGMLLVLKETNAKHRLGASPGTLSDPGTFSSPSTQKKLEPKLAHPLQDSTNFCITSTCTRKKCKPKVMGRCKQ